MKNIKYFLILVFLTILLIIFTYKHFNQNYKTIEECVVKESRKSTSNSDIEMSYIVEYCKDLVCKDMPDWACQVTPHE